MKSLILFLLICCFFKNIPAQFPAMQDMKTEIQKQVDELKKEISGLEKQIEAAKKNNPGEVKNLEKELSIKKERLMLIEKTMNSMVNFSGKEAQKISKMEEEKKTTIPPKDVKRIAQIPKKILTDAGLKLFIQQVNAEVNKMIPAADINEAEKIYNDIKSNYKTASYAANAAYGYWMFGYPRLAILIMKKAVMDDPSDADNLNNCAAFLTMLGAEQAALPILQYLDKKFPGNSTILNNIGQAWFGLGDLEMSKKYLDTTLSIFRHHSQANRTISLILEKEGKKTEAREAIRRSIKTGYSSEKESILKSLGGQLGFDDVNLYLPKTKDPFGMHQFLIPEYPMSVNETKEREAEWNIFRKELKAAIQKLRKQEKDLEDQVNNSGKQLQAMGGNVLNSTLLSTFRSPIYYKATLKYRLFIEDRDGRIANNKKEAIKRLAETKAKIQILKNELESKERAIDDKYDDRFGEGRDNPEKQLCADLNKVRDEFLQKANPMLRDANFQWIEYLKWWIEENIYYQMYIMPDELSFELKKVESKISFLSELAGLQFETVEKKCEAETEKEEKRGKLPDFDDLHCTHKVELSLPGPLKDYFSIKVECNKMTTKAEFNIPSVINLKGKMTEDLNKDEIIAGTVEIIKSIRTGDNATWGPAKVESKASVGGFIEFDNSGITDIGVIGAVSINEGADFQGIYGKAPVDLSVFGFETRYGWNSGASLKGKGILKGLNISAN